MRFGIFRLIVCLLVTFSYPKMLQAERISKLREVPLAHLKVTGLFWEPRISTNQKVGIRHAFKKCEETGALTNFDLAAGIIQGDYKVNKASDSDVYKIIEGAAYSLRHQPDPELEAYVDQLIDRIVSAQQDDGYLSTYFIVKEPDKRWTNLPLDHELYCAGHFFEAAIAYYHATGKRKMLGAAVKLAEHIDSIFGPGKRYEVPGHQEIELALVKLYQETGEMRYLNLAKFFLDERGYAHGKERKPFEPEDKAYLQMLAEQTPRFKRLLTRNGRKQDHKPLMQQYEAVGHAVRAGYMYSAMADIAAMIPDPAFEKNVDRLWNDVVSHKIYITGGIGTAQYRDEGFGDPYLLPNERAYCETCAAVANILWNHRMNMLHGDAKYVDILELALYNGFLSGVSLSGDKFFYRNPLASNRKNQRRPWYIPACCPSNVVRLLPQIGKYIYTSDNNGIYVNLFVGSTIKLLRGGNVVKLKQSTKYPWVGKINISVNPDKAATFDVNIRIPGWAQGRPVPSDLYRFDSSPYPIPLIKINSRPFRIPKLKKGYATIHRTWQNGDIVELNLPMPIHRVYAYPRVEADQGRVSLMRGPVVYCLEQTDHESDVREIVLPKKAKLTANYQSDLLGGVTVLKGQGATRVKSPITVTAIPYYAWNNRQAGSMVVWLIENIELSQKFEK